MFLDQMEERGARDKALEDSVQQAEQSGLSADGACRLRDILSRRVDAFRRALWVIFQRAWSPLGFT